MKSEGELNSVIYILLCSKFQLLPSHMQNYCIFPGLEKCKFWPKPHLSLSSVLQKSGDCEKLTYKYWHQTLSFSLIFIIKLETGYHWIADCNFALNVYTDFRNFVLQLFIWSYLFGSKKVCHGTPVKVSVHEKVRKQPMVLCSLLLPCGFWGQARVMRLGSKACTCRDMYSFLMPNFTFPQSYKLLKYLFTQCGCIK